MTPVTDQVPQEAKAGWQQQLGSALELIPKLAALGGVAYICGLVVVQIHLQRFGVNRLGFFAPQYIAAGLWGIGFTTYFAGLAFATMVKTRQGELAIRSPVLGTLGWGWSLASRLIGLLAAALAFAAALVGLLRLLFGSPFDVAWLVVGGVLFLLWCGVAAMLSSRLAGSRTWGPPPQANPWFAILPDSVILFTIGLVLFGKFIYPSIPARWGGGEPVPVQLVVTAEGADRLFKATILADTSQAVWGRLLLLTDDDVLILPKGHARPVLLQRDLVPAIVLEPVDTGAINQ